MDVTLRVQKPVCFNQSHRQSSLLNAKPFTGFLTYKPSTRLSQSFSWRIDNPAHGIFRSYSATGDFSRKRQKKWSTARSRSRNPKGFAPKAPAGTGLPKRNQIVAEDQRNLASTAPELGARAEDVGSSSAADRNVVRASKVNRSKEQWTDGTDRTVGDLPPPEKGVGVATQHLLKEVENVRGLLGEGEGEGEGSSGTVFDETRVEDEGFDRDEMNSALENYQRTEAQEKLPESDEGIDSDEMNTALENYQRTEAQEKFAESEVSESETRDSDILISNEKATADLENIREGLTLVDDQSSEADNYGTDGFDEATYEKGVKDVNYQNAESDLVTSEKEVKDFATVPESPSLVSNKSMEHYISVTESGVLGSEPVDTSKMDMKELSVTESGVLKPEAVETLIMDMKELESSLRKLVLEKEEEESRRKMELEREALRKQAIEEMAEDSFSKGNKVFIYPGTAKPDEDIELFFNRSFSSLQNEPDVVILGAFNDWRWKSFAKKLKKSHLIGDWWTCKIHVPKEAYKMDFVFSNEKDIYDNNDKKDFHIIVEGGMDVSDFEDFLLEEKRRELEELAREQAEKERQAAEQRRKEEEEAAIEADRAQARVEVEKRRETLSSLMNKVPKSLENAWFFKPHEFGQGDSVRLHYNRGSGPLSQANDIWIHGGYNRWENGVSIVAKLAKSEELDADWWYAEVTVPDQAIVLDWVFADGPPQNASRYDNNKYQDFHAIVPKAIPDELYWVEEERQIYHRLRDERRAREEAIREKAEKIARMKAETKERTLKTFLLSQRHIVYTDPVDIQAGKDVTVYYNPSNTVLNGKPEIWFRGSFNRWTHRRGPLPPQKMLPAENGTHVKTTVKVPSDAYMMDFVFSEREDGGIFDNKYGMDYHIPVFGGVAKEPPIHIVHIAVEMAPIAKVGGLGDVVTSLSRAVQDLNHHVDIVLPKYDCLNTNHVKDLHYQRSYPWGGIEIKVWFGKVEGLSVYFLEPQNGFFSTGRVYGCRNDGERFGFFCHAALEFLRQSGFHPDIIHCHDWSSAPVTWLYKDHYQQCSTSKARVVFTIHNLEFGANLIAKAMAYADKATTVSGTYSREVAGNPAIAPHLYKFHGILNGIDPDIWDPYNDKFLPVPYTSENVAEGKQAAKELLQQRLSIKKLDAPVVGIISRLTHQKGIHLIKHAIWRTLERNGQVVLLGSAPDPRIQQEFVDISNQMHNLHNDRARLILTYDEPLSHLIYAGADFIIVPSIFEPCGLTQLVAMRYGAIPVVRKTGGLYDTVFDVDHDQERAKAHGLEPNGFSFEGADPGGVDYALNRAISAWYNGKEWLNTLRKRVMEQDWSWNRPALEYMELYHAARKN